MARCTALGTQRRGSCGVREPTDVAEEREATEVPVVREETEVAGVREAKEVAGATGCTALGTPRRDRCREGGVLGGVSRGRGGGRMRAMTWRVMTGRGAWEALWRRREESIRTCGGCHLSSWLPAHQPLTWP